jgi:hypothetical protein
MENQSNFGNQNTQDTGQSHANQPLTPSDKPKTNNLKQAVVIAAFFAVLLFGGYFLNKQLFINPQTTNQENSVTPTADLTADWETYTGADYSFKHPKGLKSDTGAAGTGFESIRVQFMGPKQVASGRTQTSLFDGYSFVVTKIGSDLQKTPAQWADERINNLKDGCGPEVSWSEVKQITIDKETGVQYTVENCMGDYTASYVAYNGNVYEITQLYVGEETDQRDYEEITNQIFNSLKFF